MESKNCLLSAFKFRAVLSVCVILSRAPNQLVSSAAIDYIIIIRSETHFCEALIRWSSRRGASDLFPAAEKQLKSLLQQPVGSGYDLSAL